MEESLKKLLQIGTMEAPFKGHVYRHSNEVAMGCTLSVMFPTMGIVDKHVFFNLAVPPSTSGI